MNKITTFTLKVLGKIFQKVFNKKEIKPNGVTDPNQVSELISNLLTQDKPCMIARFGSTELNVISNYWSIKNNPNQYWKYIKGEIPPWWWNEKGLEEIYSCSGFFPATIENVSRFSEMMIEDMQLVDILGSWRPEEEIFKHQIKDAKKVNLELLNPYWGLYPWTKSLKNKKVLVMHPFAKTIETQYHTNRGKIFHNPDMLPEFELKTIKAVQSLGGESNEFKDWFEALDWMKKEIDKQDFDIALIGCGAYGFPLAAYIKRKGKKAIHMGGGLQLLFGIRGKRWEDPNYNTQYNYSALINEHWVRPDNTEQTANMNVVEGSCYW